MTQLKKIRLSSNAEVLSEQEMKAIKGGSIICTCDCGAGEYTGYCSGSSVETCLNYYCAGLGCDKPASCRYGVM